ncbi:MAG: CHAT domain-containing protein, partial [Janthinobacterium lividum]
LGWANRGRFDLSRRQVRTALELLPPGGEAVQVEAAQVQTAQVQGSQVQTAQVAASRLEVRLLTLLSMMEYELTGGQGGREHLDAALTVSTRVGAVDLTFFVTQTYGLRALRGGAVQEALDHFAAAEPLMDAASDLDVCKMLVNRGSLHLELLDLTGARRDFERCIARAADDPALEMFAAMARHNLGYAEFLGGNLPAALRHMDEALRTGDQTSLATSLLDRARVLTEAGLTDAADASLREAAEHFRRGRAWASLAETELSGAQLALLTGRFDLVRRLAGSARTRFRRRGNQPWRRRAELLLLAGDLGDGRPPGLLVAPALRLAGEFDVDGLTPYATTARLIGCEALLAAGRLTEAEAVLATTAPLRRTDLVELRLQRRTVAAQLARAAGDRDGARAQVRRGLDALVRYQAQLGSVDLQTASALHGRRLAVLDLDLALEAGRAGEVFAALERGRAQSRRLVPVTPPAGASATSLVELRQLTTTLHEIGADPGRRDEARALRERVARVEERLRGLAWQTDGLGSASGRAALPRVRERLAARGRQLVVLGRHGDAVVAVVLGRGRPRLVRFPGAGLATALTRTVRADLDVVARSRLPERLRTSATASATHKLAALDHLLLDPLGLSDEPLVVVPTADLSTLPWGCLPSLRGRPVEVAPTAGAWLRRAATDQPVPARVLALAGPGVPGASDEVAGVAATWPGARVLDGPSATGRAFAEHAPTATIAHLAAHGHHVAQNPLFSSLELADGPLLAYELDAGQ